MLSALGFPTPSPILRWHLQHCISISTACPNTAEKQPPSCELKLAWNEVAALKVRGSERKTALSGGTGRLQKGQHSRGAAFLLSSHAGKVATVWASTEKTRILPSPIWAKAPPGRTSKPTGLVWGSLRATQLGPQVSERPTRNARSACEVLDEIPLTRPTCLRLDCLAPLPS